jgi:two-component system, cell cycle response regulator
LEEPDLELVELRRRIAKLKEEARKNEEAWQRSQRREMALLDADDLPALLAELTEGLRRSYRLLAATLALVDPHHDIRHLLDSRGEAPAVIRHVTFVDGVDDVAPQLPGRVRPWLGTYLAADHAALFPGVPNVASVALLPLMRHGRAVGSLHFGSGEAHRFTQQHATDFLHHLGIIAAFCLENAVNRAHLVRSGFTDVLTGWHNRRYLQSRLKEELARSQREGVPLSCLVFDVDHFKAVNDNYGHGVGDEVLRQLARRIEGEVRSSDVSARYGGEEFVLLLPRTSLETGRVLAERIRSAVAGRPFHVAPEVAPLTVTISIGLAAYEPGAAPEDPLIVGERLIARADLALYEAKSAGRNMVVLSGPEPAQ